MILKYIYKILLFASFTCCVACDSLLDVNPPTDSLTGDQVYESEVAIEALRDGLYSYHLTSSWYFRRNMTIQTAMYADEALWHSSTNEYGEFHKSTCTLKSMQIEWFWEYPYAAIYHCNDLITNLKDNTIVTETVKNKALGESYFFRAFNYLNLVNYFNNIPLILSTDVYATMNLPQVSAAKIYSQIFEDLTKAEEILISVNNPGSRFNSEAATALLARAYLYDNQWQKAIDKANLLIPTEHGGSGTKFKLETFDKVFNVSSKESILYMEDDGMYGDDRYVGYSYFGAMINDYGSKSVVAPVSKYLVADLQSDTTDLRNGWIKENVVREQATGQYTYYKLKYTKTPPSPAEHENFVFLRLVEQYFIRAEANAQLGNLTEAIDDINIVRARAGVKPLPSTLSKDEILAAILKERRLELFYEGPHRWFDLRRAGKMDEVLSKIDYKNGWAPHKEYFPIPQSQIDANINLVQNPGY